MSNENIIKIDGLVKDFKIPVENKKKGFLQKVKNVFYKKYEEKRILKGLLILNLESLLDL